MGLLTQVALKKSELGSVDGLYSVRIKNEYGIKRMETIVKVSDGFTLAQKDLELRGPGDVLGTKQTGVPDFKIGDPVKQINILQIAQQEAISLINQPGWEKQPENRELVGYENYLLKKHSMID